MIFPFFQVKEIGQLKLVQLINKFLFLEMSSQQSSFRQDYQFPPQGPDRKHRKYGGKGVRHHKICMQSARPLKQSFYDVVRKAKNVAMFTQTLKQKIAQSKSLNQDNLKARQLAYLQNDSQIQKANILFTFHSRFILAFDIAFVSIMLVYLWAATVQMVFGNMVFSISVKILAIMVYLLRIVLFNLTEYKNQKFEYISNRKEIQSIYKNEKLLKDIIFLMMVTLQFFPQVNSINILQSMIRLVTIISFSQISETWQKIQSLLCLSTQAETILSILLLLFKIAIFIHFLSIALNLLAILEIHLNITPTWVEDNGISFDSDFQKYIVGWYWGATILSTVGFGDITPKNNHERFFVSLVQVICCMTFGYFVNVIGSLFKLRAESEEKYEKLLRSLNRCLNFLSASNDIKHKIRTYFFNRHSIEQMHDPNEEKQVLQNLTPNLKDALLLANNMNMLQKCPSIMKFKQDTLNQLTKVMKKVIMAPQTILYSGKTIDRKIWFMENGVIQQYTDNKLFPRLKKCISNYDEKDCIVGWIYFLTQSTYKTLAKSKNFTIAYQLQSLIFQDLVKKDRQQYHKLLHMKDSMILKNRKYTNKCLSCDRYTHNVVNCPRIHFIRKNIHKLQTQFKNLTMFINSQKKKKKNWERSLVKFNWKNRFATGEMQNQANILMSNESNKMNTNTIQNFFKNMMFRQSVLGFQKRKMSVRMIKKQTKLEKQVTEPIQIKEDSQVKSCISNDSALQEEQLVYFDKCFFQEQMNYYMPDHQVLRVISGYNVYMKSEQPLKRRKIGRIP